MPNQCQKMFADNFDRRFCIFDVPISAIDISSAVNRIASWIERREARYVCVADVHNVMLAQESPELMSALRGADMITPDGQPLAWLGKWLDHDVSRVCGPDLLTAVCQRSVAEGWRHYFYGGAEGVAEELAARLSTLHDGLIIAGFDSPPFRPLTDHEKAITVAKIMATKPDIVWVGLGSPKQVLWMHEHVHLLPNSILIGVGAAFDFHTGRVRRAPRLMRENGLEWLHRLISEPRRLWRRYLLLAPRFMMKCLGEYLFQGATFSSANRGQEKTLPD